MNYISSDDQKLWLELNKLFSLPPHCKKIVLTMEANHDVTLQVTHSALPGTDAQITKNYNLVEVNEV